MRNHLHALVLTERQVLVAHARWMTWNLLLALVPLVLALVLFRPGRRQRLLWWVGVIAFVGFLPNAPYVLTDAIHLVADVRRLQHPSALIFGLLPLYGVFFSAGFACYVVSLVRLCRYLRQRGRARLALPTEAALHVLAAVGIFLGRFERLNSWDVLARPGAITTALRHLADGRSLAIVATALAVIAVGKAVSVGVAQTVRQVVLDPGS
jgi:uncharacterized membrane protein